MEYMEDDNSFFLIFVQLDKALVGLGVGLLFLLSFFFLLSSARARVGGGAATPQEPETMKTNGQRKLRVSCTYYVGMYYGMYVCRLASWRHMELKAYENRCFDLGSLLVVGLNT